MNVKEIKLDELDLHSPLLEEGLSAVIHTILFVRTPNEIKAEDYNCKKLAPLVYAKYGSNEVNQTVKKVIRELNKVRNPSMTSIYQGFISISFFEMKNRKAYLGFGNFVEKTYFERWDIPIVIKQIDANNEEWVNNSSSISYIIELTRNQVSQRIASVLEYSNQYIDHIPFNGYEYEIEVKSNNLSNKNISIENMNEMVLNKLVNSPITLNNT